MFTQKIIDSDAFLDMPLSTQALYFHMNMRADDDGFVNNPRRIQRAIGASDDDLKLLIVKRFVIGFDSGIIVIKHWRMHNTLRKDRYNPTQYQEELAMLDVRDDKIYTEKPTEIPMTTKWQPNGNHLVPQYSIEESSKVESRKEKSSVRENTHALFVRLADDYILSDDMREKIGEWIAYKTERKEPYKDQGMKSLLRQIENNSQTYGERAVCELIDECMASGWKGIIFDRLKRQDRQIEYKLSGNPFLDLLKEGG